LKDTWWNHNTDKILLFILTILLAGITVHIIHHDAGDMQAFGWASGAFSTVLGALVMILTGRISRADNQTANGQPPTPTTTGPVVTPETHPQTWVKK
jgi:hypothetical protein